MAKNVKMRVEELKKRSKRNIPEVQQQVRGEEYKMQRKQERQDQRYGILTLPLLDGVVETLHEINTWKILSERTF